MNETGQELGIQKAGTSYGEARSLPLHIGVIMDGNGRWAQARKLPRWYGHRQGVKQAQQLINWVFERGIRYLTLYVFSSDNWGRPSSDVGALMGLLAQSLQDHTAELVEQKIRVRILGELAPPLPEAVIEGLRKLESQTAIFHDKNLLLALNYSARTEVVRAVTRLIQARTAGSNAQEGGPLNWEELASYLYTAGVPDPDLIIRSSGETRLSNFLLLQSAYAELYFSPVLWPDFTQTHLEEALLFFAHRERRFGGTP